MQKPQADEREHFLHRFGGVFEHSPWVAEGAYESGARLGWDIDQLHQTMCAVINNAGHEQQLALINIHPDLAGKLALADDLTESSREEQSSAGLNRLNLDEFARFTALNNAYKARFGFVFIMAVRGKSKDDILSAFEARLLNDQDHEFRTALGEIAKITRMRLDLISAEDIRP